MRPLEALRFVLLVALLVLSIGCGDGGVGPGDRTVASVAVSPDSVSFLSLGQTHQLTAVALDGSGNAIAGKTLDWSSSNASVATVDSTGAVVAMSDGTATVTASADGVSGNARVSVLQTVAAVAVSPDSAVLTSLGDTIRLTAVAQDSLGNEVPDRTFTWSVYSGADIDSTGLVTATHNGYATVLAVADGIGGTATVVTDQVPTQVIITVQPSETLIGAAITPPLEVTIVDARGNAVLDETGLVTVALDANPTGTPLLGSPAVFANRGVAVFSDLALDADGAGYRFSVGAGALPAVTSDSFDVSRFAEISAGHSHTCALATTGTAFCWGLDVFGSLGNGSSLSRSSPFRVTGDHSFASVSVGTGYTCGVSEAGEAYCWGFNLDGQLGDGTTEHRSEPVLVAGGHTFVAVSAGESHTCALATDEHAYCWGFIESSSVPVLVDGAYAYSSVSAAGLYQVCGLTTSDSARCWGRLGFNGDTLLSVQAVDAGPRHNCALRIGGGAYCWGYNESGQLGIGTSDTRGSGDVLGGLVFISIEAGGWNSRVHSCGITTDQATHCWGNNYFGQLGAASAETCGFEACSTTPVQVTGGLTFASVTAGGGHTCGVTTDGLAYCWGDNSFGQLGDGTTTNRSGPVRVGGL